MSHVDSIDIAERRRLDALASYRIAGSGPENRFDRICRFASELFSTRMAFVTLIEEDRQWFKACSGLDIEETHRSESFCDHTIRTDDVLVVSDARHDARFSSLPIVTGEPFIRFYAGAPLVSPDGFRIGALCIADTQVRESFSERERRTLAGLAAMVMEHMELRREGIPQATAANFANATDLSLVTVDPTGRIEFVNQAALDMFGFGREEMIGGSLDIIVPERFRAAHNAGLARVAAGGNSKLKGKTVEVSARRKDGTEFPIEMALSIWHDQRGVGVGAIIKDISERRDRDVRLLRLASQDTLTGLCNRPRFEDLLREELARKRPLAVLLFDLDGFKDVNDRLGHGVGDSLLQAIGVRLPAVLDRNVTVSRFGGDEFAILIPGTGDPLIAQKTANAVIEAFKIPFEVAGHTFRVGASVGFSLAPNHGSDAEELIASADFALYRAKQAGGRVVRMFEQSMRNETLARRTLRDELLRALNRHELVLHYQPQVTIETGEVFGVEALIRWQHPERGLLSPAAFLPALEQSSIALDVGLWVLDEAGRQMAAWNAAGYPPIKMGVNLFPAQVRAGDLARSVVDLIARYGLDPRFLEIEITETVTLNDDDQSLESIQALSELGVGIAFDDFGTGYASLGSLQRYPLTTLKIDMGFVRDLLTKPRDAAITRALIMLSKELGLKTIAEGIETEEQEAALRLMGCEAGQGYRYGKPMPADEVARLFVQPIEKQRVRIK
ncbi:Diguanylate cyclase/phosphodiesterase with PAS/PAC sensor(S) [Neorhizobium galegae bv. officinalis bv. officinalis str. HAMBI 1141]|uniref:Diguanylate cyclase/phosphodiesterase with PAS/PAC sensor(S) n=1 Tax=Neorhizobium galegae bv. officinalis bv. officinalis str. HAMBI 1141 TaxID=1028801 RepID=A0A068T8P6_NEOGA|nr:EAL domain-containing protein [Neorhizobium galegae]CDN54489.1 Diguanylate cyclase/phosphodiesterase with PAS/PAC sensor(S) [Neorhizobium galegae bv. officinalis bv. officinalis str. HAMBI 1141]